MFISMVAFYFALMIGIGLLSWRRIKRIDSFFLADRRGNTVFITGSLLATIIGGSSTVGMAGRGFAWGLVGAWWMLVGVAGLILLYFLFAKTIRNYGLFTLPELLEKQYGGSVKLVASLVIVWAWLGVIGGQIVAAGKILNTLMPGSLTLLMTVSAMVFIAYTSLGGQISVIRTDAAQSAIMIAGIGVCALFSLQQTGGFAVMQSRLPADFFSFPVNSSFSGQTLLEWSVLIGSAYLVGPDIYSRLFSARDGTTAQRSVLLTALTMIPFAFAITLIGMTARVLAPSIPAEEAFPYMIKAGLPHGINALVMAALLCAVMSSADTVLLTTGTIFSMDVINDIVRRVRGTGLSEHSLLTVSRLALIFFGLLALGFALRFREVIGLLLFGYSIYTAGLVIPVVLGFYREKLKLNIRGAMAAVVGGGGWVILSKTVLFSRLELTKIVPVSAGFSGFLLSLVLLFLGSYLFGRHTRSGLNDPRGTP